MKEVSLIETDIKRVLLLGVGGYGATWVRLFATAPEYTVVSIVDINKNVARQAQEALALSPDQVHRNLDRALRETQPDVVVDTTPPRFRQQWARSILASGAHLIVAKPLAESLEDARGLVDLSERYGRRIAVNQQQRFHPLAIELARLVHTGTIGRHVCTYFSFFQRREWQDRLIHVPSPLFIESSIHHFDLFHAVLGERIVRVNAHGWTPPDITAVGVTAGTAWLELAGGGYITYQASRSSRNDLDAEYKTGWHGPWIIEGTDGVLRADEREGIFLNGECVMDPPALEQARSKRSMDRMFFDAFVDAIRSGAPFALDARENLRTLAVAHAAELSLTRGTWVDVDELLAEARAEKGSFGA